MAGYTNGYNQDDQGFYQEGFYPSNYDENSGQNQQYDQGYDYNSQHEGYDQQYGGQNYYDPNVNAQPQYYAPQSYQPVGSNEVKEVHEAHSTGFEDEPPLLEELGLNLDHVWQKTLSVLNPLKQTDIHIMDDTDLGGPFLFCLAFGGFLLLHGKVHFGYIYGYSLLGCLAMYAILNLMTLADVSFGIVVSILGYCLLPMVFLSGTALIVSLQGMMGSILTTVTIGWCSLVSSKLFVTAFAMDHQQPLVAYPCALLYGVFALLTVF